MDALSTALNAVRMTGAIFFRVDCTAPWGFAVPPVQAVAHRLAPGTERLVNFHLITEGRAGVHIEGEAELPVQAGDMVVLPHGQAHTVSNGDPRTFTDAGAGLGDALDGRPRAARLGGGGEPTQILCGFFGCEQYADRLFLAGLPPLFKVQLREDPAGAWIEQSVRHLAAEAEAGGPGTAVLLSRMAEALFVHALRRYTAQLPPGEGGWLAGARDPIVGGALALMHGEPHCPWTLRSLAAGAGTSASVLTERFARYLGESPMRYLQRWRLQLAARLLGSTARSVLEVALEVGYQSESAFNRAFKRAFGLPPAQYRRSGPHPRPEA